MNTICLSGRVGSVAPESATKSGLSILRFSLATTEYGGKSNPKVTEWHEIKIFGKRAEALAQYIEKGRAVNVVGSIRTDSWEKDGEKRKKTYIMASDVELGAKSEASHSSQHPAAMDDENVPF